MKVNMSLPCYNQIRDKGAQAQFEKIYGAWKCEPESGYDVAITINLDTLKEEEKDPLIGLVSLMKSNVLGGVFKFFYGLLKDGKATTEKPFKFDLRSDTTIYFIPAADRVTTIFSVDFREKVDKVVARVFLSEFKEARKVIKFAPAINLYMAECPTELKESFGIGQTAQEAKIIGWLSFAVLDSHVKQPENIDKIAEVLQSFRNYIQYHIKAAKTYFHSRMRAKCVDLLKVLNRAKQLQVTAVVAKKTASGKTFTRQ